MDYKTFIMDYKCTELVTKAVNTFMQPGNGSDLNQ